MTESIDVRSDNADTLTSSGDKFGENETGRSAYVRRGAPCLEMVCDESPQR